jgi:hypothetical protein
MSLLSQNLCAELMMTPWGEKVTSENCWRSYPRPQMEREGWTCLNGDWDYQITSIIDTMNRPEKWAGKIRVPFALEAPLSGCGGRLLEPHEYLWYTRKIDLNPKKGERILLHFGAVDFRAVVYLGHDEVGLHEGGQLPFTVDLTPYAKKGENTLTVLVWDPTEDFVNTRGKQAFKTHSCFYTRSSGIIQTVWLETVPEKYIADYNVTTDIDNGSVSFSFDVKGLEYGDTELGTVEIYASSSSVKAQFKPGENVTLKMPEDFKLWSPEEPNLYYFSARFGKDKIKGYFAMRKFEKCKDGNGVLRFYLNNKPYFVLGTLDQGWWPDGLLTPPSEEAMAFDIQTLKDCGYNTMRKHIKVEPLRYYALCDKMGLLVLQDMPCAGRGARGPFIWQTVKSYALYREELKGMMDLLKKVPSIVMWVPYNEGWAQHDANLTHTTLDFVKRYDPTRLVDGPSGWQDFEGGETLRKGRKVTAHKPLGECEAADVVDYHYYRGPAMPPVNDRRVSFLGEFGGLGHPVKGHIWREFDQGSTLGKKTGNWGYGGIEDTKTREGLEKTYLDLMVKLGNLAMSGLAGAIYTQTTDVEIEINGLLTYDRKVLKFNPQVLKAAHDDVIKKAALGTKPRETICVVPILDTNTSAWAWTTNAPTAGWEKPLFNDSAWARSAGGFGNAQIEKDFPQVTVSTRWTTDAIWLRRHFNYKKPRSELIRATFKMFHDEDVEVYLNGVLLVSAKGWNNNWDDFSIPAEKFNAAVKEGDNVIAVKVIQKTGGQYIDVGLSIDVDWTGQTQGK